MTDSEKLTCWNQWKERCAVLRCDAPIQEFLSHEIWGRFCWFSKNLGFKTVQKSDAATEFDSYLLEREHGIVGREPKRWKNVIWKAIEEHPEDAPMKIINGKLLGRQGVLWDVFRRWKKANSSVGVSIDEGGIQEPAEWANPDRSYCEEAAELQKRLLEALDFREKVALLALWFKISLDDSAVRSAMQIGKDACYRAKDSLCNKLRKIKAENEIIREADFMDALIVVLKNALKSENRAAALLNKIEECSKN
ncbi:MAG: hypothetical protein ACI4QA_06375 [Candidatus Spyradosoma sp.]